MKTDELVQRLASTGTPVDRDAMRRRFWSPLGAATAVCLIAVLALAGPRPDWREAALLPMFWLKLAFPTAIALAAIALLRELGHPGARGRAATLALVLPVVVLWVMAAFAVASAGAAQRESLVFGDSWLKCLVSIPALAVPALALAFGAVRSLVPTRLSLTGAVAGLAAGGVAATAYAVHCNEMQAPFLAVWYVLGMLVPAAAGWLAGPSLLRW